MLWTRPGLSRRDRSIATLSAMVANQTLDELKVHTRNAVNNGLSAAEISEVLLHAAIYSGFPKATAAFRIAREVLEEPETKKLAEENARKVQANP
jgi:3-oxoadipate enol-lactonase/4-carboxymuconolactone decarboxylase